MAKFCPSEIIPLEIVPWQPPPPPNNQIPRPCANPPPPRGRPRSPKTVHRAQKEKKERKNGKESLWLLEAPVWKIILQMHTPASQCWSRQTQHGVGVCIWMLLVNGTGNSPSPGQPTLE